MFGWSLYMASRYRGQRYNIFFGIRDRPDHFLRNFHPPHFLPQRAGSMQTAPNRPRGRRFDRFDGQQVIIVHRNLRLQREDVRPTHPQPLSDIRRHSVDLDQRRTVGIGSPDDERTSVDRRRIGTNVERTEDQSVDELENPCPVLRSRRANNGRRAAADAIIRRECDPTGRCRRHGAANRIPHAAYRCGYALPACAAVRLPDSSHSTCTPRRYLADAAARPCGGRVRRRISTVAPVRAVSYRQVAYDGS